MTDLEEDLKRELAAMRIAEAGLRSELIIAEARAAAAEQGLADAHRLVKMMWAILEQA